MTIPEILMAAKALIPDEAHWWRGYGPRPSGWHCPITAIREASGAADRPRSKEWREAGRAEAVFLMAIRGPLISRWSDHPKRTLAEVRAAFDRAAEMATK